MASGGVVDRVVGGGMVRRGEKKGNGSKVRESRGNRREEGACGCGVEGAGTPLNSHRVLDAPAARCG